MGFETVVVADVKIEKNTPPVGSYVFQLLPGAVQKESKFKAGLMELHLSASVAEGDEQGKRVFWQYPDPTAIAKNGKATLITSAVLRMIAHDLGRRLKRISTLTRRVRKSLAIRSLMCSA